MKELITFCLHPRWSLQRLNDQCNKAMLIIMSGGGVCHQQMEKEGLIIERTFAVGGKSFEEPCEMERK